MRKIFLVNLLFFNVLGVVPPDLEVRDLAQIKRSKVLYPCRYQSFYVMVNEDEEALSSFKEMVGLVHQNNKYSRLTSADEFMTQEVHGSAATYEVNETPYKIYVIPSYQIHGYWNAKEDVTPEKLHNFKQQVFDVQLFPTTAQWVWSFVSYLWRKQPTKINVENIEEGHQVSILNNFRDKRSRNGISLVFSKDLELAFYRRNKYFVKPASFHLRVLSVENGRCAFPKSFALEEVRVG